jgi:uncharacterized protein (DUF736 family)
MNMQNEKTGRKPDYRGQMDVAAWLNTDKNGNAFLSVRLANSVNLFKNRPRQEKTPVVTEENIGGGLEPSSMK